MYTTYTIYTIYIYIYILWSFDMPWKKLGERHLHDLASQSM